MSNLPEKPDKISDKVVDLLVSNVFRKNGVDVESIKTNLLDEQKKEIKDMVEELTKKVDAFTKQKPSK